MTQSNGQPVRCWVCRFALRPYEPVRPHETEVILLGKRTTITPLAHEQCIARVKRQATKEGWCGPRDVPYKL